MGRAGGADCAARSCAAGKELSGRDCLVVQTLAATRVGYSCPEGWTLAGSQCTQTLRSTSVPAVAQPVYACPAGKVFSATGCVGLVTSVGKAVMGCPYSYKWMDVGDGVYGCAKVIGYSSGHTERYGVAKQIVVDYTCPAGTVSYWSSCRSYASTPASVASYSCPSGQTLSNQQCSLPAAQHSGYSCPSGSLNASDNTCTVSGQVLTATGPASADRTLSFLYGPEHQRIKQNVALSGNGVSSYHSGNTWYLNGEDSLGLTYEKEQRTDGTTEHRHYLRAAGQTFALYVSRSGSLNGLAASATSYLHKDHLGSISAITNESGTVVERLAYDPWGKRRNIQSQPGQPAPLDQLVGQHTERGYTEHEHLDEVGVIHMNGRIYDPLMGRFMSADPEIQEPLELKSFNRYSYVWNNPLGMTDPTGFEGVISSYNYNTGHNEPVPSDSPDYVKGHVYGYSGGGGKTTSTTNQYSVQTNAPKWDVGGLRQFGSELSWSGYFQQVWRTLVDDFVKNNQEDSPDSNAYLRWVASKVAGSYTPPDATSANGVAATVSVAAIPFFTGKGEVQLVKDAGGIWRTSKIDAAKMEHIFSADHVKTGIMDLGKSKDAILNQARDALTVADKAGSLRDGMNTVVTRMNGYDATIRAFIKDGEMQSMNLFKGVSDRVGQYVIDLR